MIFRTAKLLICAFLLTAGSAGATTEIPLGEYGEWKTSLTIGRGKICAARTHKYNVGGLSLSVSEDGRVLLTIYLMAKSTEAMSFDVTLYIDEKEWAFGPRESSPGDQMTSFVIMLPRVDAERFIPDLRRGNVVALLLDGDRPLTWSLYGADGAIGRLARCVLEIQTPD
jgi:hypothetical protein